MYAGARGLEYAGTRGLEYAGVRELEYAEVRELEYAGVRELEYVGVRGVDVHRSEGTGVCWSEVSGVFWSEGIYNMSKYCICIYINVHIQYMNTHDDLYIHRHTVYTQFTLTYSFIRKPSYTVR